MTVDIPALGSNKPQPEDSNENVIGPAAQFQISELADEKPLLRLMANEPPVGRMAAVDGKILQTQWQRLVGTDLIFDDTGELVGQVRDHLQVNDRIKVVRQDKEEADDDDDKANKGQDNATSFLKRAMKAAGKK